MRSTGLRDSPYSAARIRAGRVREVIRGEALARQQVIDKRKTLLQTFAHGIGHRAVPLRNRDG